MSKKYYRNNPVISRDTSFSGPNQKDPEWADDFFKNLEKNSTTPKNSIYDQINEILGNTKSKYSTVEDAVKDLQHRTGLSKYLQEKKAGKTGYVPGHSEPEIFKKVPELKIFIDNFTESRPGISIQAIIDEVLKIKSIKDKLENPHDVGDDVKKYINDKIVLVKTQKGINQDINHNLGKSDLTDTGDEVGKDPLAILEPVVKQ